MHAFAPLALFLTDLMAEPEANHYSEFWILSPGFYFYIISAEPNPSDPRLAGFATCPEGQVLLLE